MGLHGLLQELLYLYLTAIREPIVYKNVGASMSHNPMGLHGLLQE
jgi:hypothetical protein